MSGIAGIYHPDGQLVEPEHLGRMVDILAHRGADGADIWCEGSVGLGHRMLWTTPESLLEKLPLVNQAGNLAITADARIDNRDELIPALELSDLPAEKITDSQIILAAYEKWGESCPEKLLGDFAFAIWDGQKQQLFCARDHFGIKSFYYYFSDQTFVFATEIKAILCLSEVPVRLNEVKVGDYLTSMFHDTTITFYQDILRLPAAHQMTISREGIQLKSYWSLDPSRELRLGSDKEYAAKFREIFTEAVRCRLRSAFPIGLTLSGGLDSSSIACTARKLLSESKRQPLHTFSAIFDELTECDERKYINAVINQGGLEPHYVKIDQISPLKEIQQMFWHQDGAFYAPNWFMGWALNKAAKNQGIRILLDGFDGDTTVSDGYGYLSELARAGRWLLLTREVWGLAKTFNVSFWGMLWSYVKYYAINPIISKYRLLRLSRRIGQLPTKLLRRQNHQPDDRPEWSKILSSEFVQSIGLVERYQACRKVQGHFGLEERERHYRNIATQGLPEFAAEMMDKSIAAFSMEPRYPFWDKRLVEFCLALPPEQKLRFGWNRFILRNAMTNILPVEVQWRRGKTDFSANLADGLRVREQKHLNKLIFNDLKIIEKYVNIDILQKIGQRFFSSKSQTEDARTIWIVISLAMWLHYLARGRPHEIKLAPKELTENSI